MAEPADAPVPRSRRARRGFRGRRGARCARRVRADGRPGALSSASTISGRSCGPGCRSSSRSTTSRSGSRGSQPPTAELLRHRGAVCDRDPGLLALEPARHAVALAVHAWAHVPLGRLGRLVDVAALSQGADARRAGVGSRAPGTSSGSGARRRPRSTRSFGERRRPLAGHVWARHLWGVREPTVLERHLERWLGAVLGACQRRRLPPRRAGISRISSRWRTARRARR